MAMRVGDWVEVRRESEILQTLDRRGNLEGVLFMPEMVQFCERRFQIYKSAHKTCDGVNLQSRRLPHTLHLDTRCSGEAHGGCQAACLLFWHEAWLRPVDAGDSMRVAGLPATAGGDRRSLRYTRDNLLADCMSRNGKEIRYRCQATSIREMGSRLLWWDLRQYWSDLESGNVTIREFISSAINRAWMALARSGPWQARLVRWCYDHLRILWGDVPFPRRSGSLPNEGRTPITLLNLAPGELVRVRSIEQIDRTLDSASRNRGLYFDPEQVPYANRTFRVLRRVDRIISEETGMMLPLKTPTVVLDAVVCQGRYGSCRLFCPRNAYLLWREAWLERAEISVHGAMATSGSTVRHANH